MILAGERGVEKKAGDRFREVGFPEAREHIYTPCTLHGVLPFGHGDTSMVQDLILLSTNICR